MNDQVKPPWPVPNSPYFPESSRSTLVLVIVLSLTYLASSLHRLNHTDLWGHLSFGRWISENGSLPESDPFAAGAMSEGFVNIPWLAQLIGYQAYSLLGTEALVMGQALLVTASVALSIAAIRLRDTGVGWSIAGGVVGYLLALPILGTVRPQLFGVALLPLVLLASTQLTKRWHPLVWLPVVFAVWANLHGSFAIGLACLALVLVGVGWEVYRKRGSGGSVLADSHARRLGIALVLCTLAACLNPIGPRLLVVVASFGGNAALANITEWQPLVLTSLSGILFFGSLLVSAVLIRVSPRRFTALEVLLLVALAVLALSAMRMLTWWALVWPWIFAPHAAAVWEQTKSRLPALPNRSHETNTMRTLLAMACVFTSLVLAPPSNSLISGESRGIGAITSTNTPLYLADAMRKRAVSGRIFAPMDWGDFLIWHSRARVQPLVYSHVHLIHPNSWTDYLRLSQDGTEWLAIADRHQLDYLAVCRRRNINLVRSLRDEPRAQIVYQNQQGLLVRILPVTDGRETQNDGK